jgi:hypothetical protein
VIGAVSLVLAFAINGATALVIQTFETEADCKAATADGWQNARDIAGLQQYPFPVPVKGMLLACRVNT